MNQGAASYPLSWAGDEKIGSVSHIHGAGPTSQVVVESAASLMAAPVQPIRWIG
jgi:hypothetical protein